MLFRKIFFESDSGIYGPVCHWRELRGNVGATLEDFEGGGGIKTLCHRFDYPHASLSLCAPCLMT